MTLTKHHCRPRRLLPTVVCVSLCLIACVVPSFANPSQDASVTRKWEWGSARSPWSLSDWTTHHNANKSLTLSLEPGVHAGHATTSGGLLHLHVSASAHVMRSMSTAWTSLMLPDAAGPDDLLSLTVTYRLQGVRSGYGNDPLTFAVLEVGKDKSASWLDKKRKLGVFKQSEGFSTLTVRSALKAGTRSLVFYVHVPASVVSADLDLSRLSLEATRVHHSPPALRFDAAAKNHVWIGQSDHFTPQAADRISIKAGRVSIRDERHHPLRTIDIAPHDMPIAIHLTQPGFYELDAQVTAGNGETVSAKTTAVVLPSSSARAGERSIARFGMFSVDRDSPAVLKVGIVWNRRFLPLDVVRDGHGGYRWGQAAQRQLKTNPVLNELGPYGDRQKWVMVMMYMPAWLYGSPPTTKPAWDAITPPKDWDELRRVVTWAVRHYPVDPAIIEVINEPNNRWRGSLKQLVRYHEVFARAIHDARPDAKVYGPCLPRLNLPKLRRLAELGLFKNLDGVSIHHYAGDGGLPEGGWYQRILAVESFLHDRGLEHMPVLLSEFGWTTRAGSWQPPVDELTQAEYVARSFSLLAASRIDLSLYFCLLYQSSNPGLQGFSLLYPDGAPKPGLAAFATVNRWLGGVRVGDARHIVPHPGTHMVVARRSDDVVAVLWTTRGTRRVRLPQAAARVRDMMGRPITTASDRDRVVQVSPAPIFVKLAGVKRLPRVLPERVLPQGDGIDFDRAVQASAAEEPGLHVEGGRHLRIAPDAPVGDYALWTRDDENHWAVQPVRVVTPVAIYDAGWTWNASAHAPSDRITIRNQTRATLDAIQLSLSTRAGTTSLEPVHSLKPGESKSLDLRLATLGAKPGRPFKAALHANTTFNEHDVETVCHLSGRPLLALPMSDGQHDAVIPLTPSDAARFGDWSPAAGNPGDDLHGNLSFRYDKQGLHLRAEVTDDEHRQDAATPSQMWSEDSIQLALDMDAGLPRVANGPGWEGHTHVYELTLADDGKGGVTAFRSMSYDPERPSGTVLPKVSGTVTQSGNVMLYEVLISWETIGRDAPPPVGTGIGVSLAMNDVDPAHGRARHGLKLFDGIVSDKNPAQYGLLWFTDGRE